MKLLRSVRVLVGISVVSAVLVFGVAQSAQGHGAHLASGTPTTSIVGGTR